MDKGAKVLIVDDERTFLISTAELLRNMGWQCQIAEDAAGATKIIGTCHIDVLVSDINMPGNEQLQFIKELPKLAPGLPVILLTGFPSVQTATESIRLPVIAYLTKPIDINQLDQELTKALTRSRTYQAVSSSAQTLAHWQTDLHQLEELMCGPLDPQNEQASLDTYFSVTIGNLVHSIGDLKRLTENLLHNKDEKTHELLRTPSVEALSLALFDTITVLEKTKQSFKSKELAELRRRLESLVARIPK